MKNILMFLSVLLFIIIMPSNAQVKISDTGSTSPGAYSILELESTTKGFLGPRVTLTDLSLVTPLTGTVPAGMLVYNSGGTITNGYYVWNGTKWMPFATGMGSVNVVAKIANTTLLKTETFVAASGNITLTLPVVTSTDDGLAITIKNIGTYTDQIDVDGNGAATIDGRIEVAKLFRWKARTFVAYGGNWLRREKDIDSENVFNVSPSGSWKTIDEVLAFLNLHMLAPSVVFLDGGQYDISSTQVINLPHLLTIQGPSYGVSTIAAANGLGGLPMFSCISDCVFKMLAFDGTSLATYGNFAGEDAMQLITDGTFFEIKDCTFDHFNKTINVKAAIDLWFFESDITDAVVSGVELAADAADVVTFKTSETDFTNCAKGINLVRGENSVISVQNCNFLCGSAGQTGIVYVPNIGNFYTPASIFITNTAWNNIGTYMSGFDFTLASGRDANFEIVNNAGLEDKNAKCKLNIVNNASTTICTTAGIWYKANWSAASQTSITNKWTISTTAGSIGRMTFQPANTADCFIIVSGNVSVNNAGRVITIAIVKNGVTGTRYGETTLRTVTANQAFQYATTIYIQNVAQTNYFELYVSSTNNNDVVTFQDVNIFVNAQ